MIILKLVKRVAKVLQGALQSVLFSLFSTVAQPLKAAITDQTPKPTRSPSSGIDWTLYDLITNNITLTHQSPRKFFRRNASPSFGGLDPTLYNSITSTDKIPSSTTRYLARIRFATNADQDEAGLIDDLARETLRLTGFEEDGLFICANYPIPSTICGHDLIAQIDVCLLEQR